MNEVPLPPATNMARSLLAAALGEDESMRLGAGINRLRKAEGLAPQDPLPFTPTAEVTLPAVQPARK